MAEETAAQKIGRVLRRARQKSGALQRRMAAATDISAPRLSQIEKGVVLPRVDELWPLAEAYKVDVLDLIPRRRGLVPR